MTATDADRELGDEYADLLSHDTYTEGVPHATFARLRRDDPVSWIDEPDGSGFWAITRYRDIIDVSRSPELFTTVEGIRLEEMSSEETAARRTMMEHEAPTHTRLRRLVSRGFTRRRVEAYEDQIRQLAVEVMEEALPQGEFDFVDAVAKQLPMKMLGKLLGTPDEDGPFLVEQGDALLGNTDPDFTDHVIDQVDTDEFRLIPFRSPAGLRLFDYARQQAAIRRTDPTDDIISQLLATTTDGSELTEHEFNNFFTLLVAAGNDTTRYTMTGGLKALLERPHLIDYLRTADEQQWFDAVEEILRWTSVTMHFRRTAAQDLTFGGKEIKAGDKVVVYFISGDYDEDEFVDPFTFDLTRSPNDHMAFGRGGPHLCLGAWLARMEVRVTLQEFIRRVDTVTQTGPEARLRSNFIAGIKRLPIAVT